MGSICEQTADSPTLTTNTIGRHISKMVYTKVVIQQVPVARLALSLAAYTATRYPMARDVSWPTRNGYKKLRSKWPDCDPVRAIENGNAIHRDEFWNPNGSYYGH